MRSDEEITTHLKQLTTAVKRIEASGSWTEEDYKTTTRLKYKSAVSIEGVTIAGLFLYGRTLKNTPERNLTFPLMVRYGGVDYQLGRLDWRPLRPHTNRVGPEQFQTIITGSQWHSFNENADLGLDALKERNLPFARPINPDLKSFNDVLDFLGEKFTIENAQEIPVPPWDMQEEFTL